MSAIQVVQSSRGLEVSYPFALKDQFKKAFPSAKCDPDNKVWVVGLRSAARLTQWVEAAESAARAIMDAEEAALTEQELAQVRGELTSFRQAIEDARSGLRALTAVRELLDGDRAELNAARAELTKEQVATKAAEQQVLTLLAGIIDMPAILAAAQRMAAVHSGVGARNREEFDAAQAIIVQQRNALTRAGYRSRGISELATANFNRPDRDHPRFVTTQMLYDISKLEVSSDDT
ncbi:hypothetical protein C7S18_23560 (plasmid) [Ahniella affigens]|uniref:Uncharacterized protein n=1 Tax=Ahniella affigens TaxID=2021234 RepID=A0A2P1PZL9_9GAMM|nr:hypothetical protein [Ahniella affigens]AVQ00277.1 hypothetical protein C7S18_23560 [Ahniella affigens]